MVKVVRLVAFLLGLLPDAALSALMRFVFVRSRLELRRACADPRAAQEARLLAILARHADTEAGRAHGFSAITDVDAFRARVPLSSWDDVAPKVERMLKGEKKVLVDEDVFFYATTSGTTGRRKLVPVTSSFVAECRTANKLLYAALLTQMPGFLRGRRLSMRSPAVEEVGAGALAGSITVALSGALEDAEDAFDAVPLDVFRIEDFQTRYFLALRFALQEKVTIASAVNPSTLLLFARTLEDRWQDLAAALESGALGDGLILDDASAARLRARAARAPAAAERLRRSAEAHGAPRMADAFPDLVGLVCWKAGSAPWYLERIKKSYGPLPVLDYGYAASEGCFGAPVSVEGAESVLLPHGHFVELIPEDDVEAVRAGRRPTTLLHEAEPGRRYFVVVTTGSGLYRYEMNDVVEVTGRLGQAPLVVFRHKGGAVASVTGEKVTESHVVEAMAQASRSEGALVRGFVAAPVLPDDGEPYYVLALDSALDEDALPALAESFDAALRRLNVEYDGKRASLRLGPVRAAPLPAGCFVEHRRRRVAGGAPDAHVKIPHVDPDGRLLVDLGVDETAPDVAPLLPCRAGAAAGAA